MKNWRLVFSLVIFSAILPVVLWGVVNGQPNKLISKADQYNDLRIWFEPAELKIKQGRSAEIKIMAGYDETSKIIPGLELSLRTPSGLVLTPDRISYKNPFTGQVNLGSFRVQGLNTGSFEIRVIDESVNTGLTDLKTTTYPVKLVVEP